MTTTAALAAAPTPDHRLGEWRLDELTPLAEHAIQEHEGSPDLDSITGYIVRRTIVAGVTVPDGVDVAVYPAAGDGYSRALDLAWTYRSPRAADTDADQARWGWAVVDRAYACGCRS